MITLLKAPADLLPPLIFCRPLSSASSTDGYHTSTSATFGFHNSLASTANPVDGHRDGYWRSYQSAAQPASQWEGIRTSLSSDGLSRDVERLVIRDGCPTLLRHFALNKRSSNDTTATLAARQRNYRTNPRLALCGDNSLKRLT